MSHAISVSVQQKQCSNSDSFESTNCRPSVGIRKIRVKLWNPGCLALIVVTGMLAYLCPAYAQTNLVQDPGFEKQSNTEGASLVSPWSGQGPGQTYSDTGSAHSGSHDGSMQSNNSSSTVTNIVQTVPVTASTNYTLSGWFTVASAGISSGEFGARTTAGVVIAQTAVSSSLTSYKQLTVTFSSGSNTSIVIFGGAILGANSILRTDDLSLTASGAPPPDPKVTSISPASGPTTGGTVAAVYGSGFESGASVTYGSTKSSAVTFISSTEVKAMTPAESVGTVSVTITNPDNGTGSMSKAFTYTAGPTISSISPNSGAATGGTTVTISGSGFKSGATVALGAFLATSVSVLSSTQIQAVTPAEPAGTVSVTITNSDLGTATLPSAFTFSGGGGGQPTISSATTDPGAANSSATCVNQLPVGATKMCTLTINGSNLSGASVTIDGAAATNVVSSSSQVTATVPTSSKTDQWVNLSVTTSGGTVTLTNGFFYGKIIFQDGFESGNYSAWTCGGTSCNSSGGSDAVKTQGSTFTFNSTTATCQVHSGTYGNCIVYGGAAGSDVSTLKTISATTHLFERGYVWFDPWVGTNGGNKLTIANNVNGDPWSFISEISAGTPQLMMWIDGQGSNYNIYGPYVTLGQWNSYEDELQINIPGNPSDRSGYVNIWWNGSLAASASGLGMTGSYNDQITQVIYGKSRGPGGTSENRHWDDIVVADAYIP